MAEIKLNKTELKKQKVLLNQLTKYLPTLQLKKQQLQVECDGIRNVVEKIESDLLKKKDSISSYAILFTEKLTLSIEDYITVVQVDSGIENIAGVDVPLFKAVIFDERSYSYFITPVWFDNAVIDLKELISIKEKARLTRKRLELLEEELRQTTIKVNLFEKRMIPKCKENIKKIKIFLGDQEIAAICNAKIAKDKLKKKEFLQLEAV